MSVRTNVVLATALLAVALTSTAHSVTPVSQNRTITVFATATNPEEFSHDSDQRQAPDYGLFDETAEVTQSVTGSSAMATASHRSEIFENSFFFLGSFHAEATNYIEGGFSEAFGQSLFNYNFSVTTPTHLSIYGELTAFNEGACHFTLIGPGVSINTSHFEEGTIPLLVNEELGVGSYQLAINTNGFGQAAPGLDTEADGSITVEGFFSPVVAVPDAAVDPAVLSAYPNPTRGIVTFELTLDTDAITIFDAGGRHVRSLDATANAGPVTWDGRDATGVRVAPGVYFYRAGSTDRIAPQRLIVLD